MSMTRGLNLEEMEKVVGGLEDPIVEQTVTWQDANGNTYSYPVKNRKKDPADDIISQTVTWQDASGNTYSTKASN